MARTSTTVGWVMCVMVSHAAYGQTQQAGTRLKFESGLAKTVVQQAIRGAAARLEHEACQLVLTDFTDEFGRTLRQNLERLERRPAEFLAELWFVDRSSEPSCKQNHDAVAAFTNPFSRVVYVCGAHFISPQLALRGRPGEFVIIHEMLHALGLGEYGRNPTPQAITSRIIDRCGNVG